MISARSIIAVLILLLTGCSSQADRRSQDPISLTAFRSESGWGYTIAINGKDYIRQPYIPAISGKIPFRNEQDAIKTGSYVCNLIRNRKAPALRVGDLAALGILPDTTKANSFPSKNR